MRDGFGKTEVHGGWGMKKLSVVWGWQKWEKRGWKGGVAKVLGEKLRLFQQKSVPLHAILKCGQIWAACNHSKKC